MSDRMGSIAAQDAFDVPLDQGTNVGWANRLSEGGSNVLGGILNATGNVAKGLYRDIPRAANWFYRQASKPEAEAQADTRNVMGGLAEQLYTLPQRALGASQEAVTTGNYNPAPAVETALTIMGGGVAGTGEKAVGPGLGAGWSSFKLAKPIEEMSSVVKPISPAAETVINPARLQGGLLLPLVGDRTAAAAELARVNGFKFENPVALQGGHGYMANNPGMAWAAGKSIAPGIASVAKTGAETGKPVYGVYTAMSETAPDFSTMMSDTLTEMLKHTKPTREGTKLFNETMKAIDPGFPSVRSAKLPEYLRSAPGGVRSAFAKAMDTAEMSKHGFPSVAEARVAVTDPRLLDVPTGASGLSIAKMDPQGRLGPSGHGTYDTGIVGNYVGGLPTSIPKEVMYPDVVGALSKHADAVAAKRVAEGLKYFRPTEDYLMTRTPKGLPRMQEANQQWVDTNSKYLLDRGFTLGSGATDKKGAAAIQGIRAYHSSPHDFDKFDLSKIGTGEGAQAYGHGLYFAENPAVSGQGGQYWNQFRQRFDIPERNAALTLSLNKFNREAAIAEAQAKIVDPRMHHSPASLARAQKELELLESGKPVGPRTYEVEIAADPAHMLDWDKPLRDQGSRVAGVHKDFFPSGYTSWGSTPETGEQLYRALAAEATRGTTKARDVVAASERLGEAGIPGIKYLDEGSRNYSDIAPFIAQHGGTDKALAYARGRHAETMKQYGEGSRDARDWAKTIQEILNPPTSNYVMFDPDLIRIMKKYGIAGAAPAGMGALAAQDNYQQ